MITYIYFVKCPGCEDEHFDFFDEAKEYALGCLTKKPIITQTEVDRNDFGECTDSSDLGTVWSWEDMMQDTESDDMVFSKDETFGISEGLEDLDDFLIGPQIDEFANLDNSVDFEIEEDPEEDPDADVKPVEESCKKPIPEGMTIEELIEEMEENEDTVECKWCQELFPKAEGRFETGFGGLICRDCQNAAASRGEPMTYKSTSYWDFLDESAEDTRTFAEIVKDSINHLTNDLGKDPWAEDFADAVIGDLERNYESFVPEDFTKYQEWCSAVASEVSRQVNNLTEASLPDVLAGINREQGTTYNERDFLGSAGIDDGEFFDELETQNEITAEAQRNKRRRQAYAINKAKAAKTEGLTEAADPSDEFVLYYDDLDFEYVVDRDTITDALVDLVTDEEVQRLTNGRFQTAEEICDYDTEHYYKVPFEERRGNPEIIHEWTKFLDDNCDELFAAHEQEVMDYLKDNAKEAKAEADEEDSYEHEPTDLETYGYYSSDDFAALQQEFNRNRW